MTDQSKPQFDFSDVAKEEAPPAADPSFPTTGDAVADAILASIEQLAGSIEFKIHQLEAHFATLEGRMSITEKYMGYLLTCNPDFKDWLKTQTAAAADKGTDDVGQTGQGT